MKSLARLVLVGCFAIVPILATGCADEKEVGTKPPTPNAYVGAAACASCHADIAATVSASLHPHMVTVVNGQRPADPTGLPDLPPGGSPWADFKYVIGGSGWKALFVTTDMQVATGAGSQYNIPTAQFSQGEWVAYHTGTATPYNYACFRCHTTGPDERGNTFNQPGVQCEACHGQGKSHASSGGGSGNIVRDDSALACGQCHSHDPAGSRIAAANGFIASEQQYAELKEGPHAGRKCTECHDPHKGLRRGQAGGIVRDCTSAGCHPTIVSNHRGGGSAPRCIDCHMGRATMSARSVSKYQGDVRTHIFRIHDGAEGQAAMFETVGAETYVKQGYGVTLDFACYSCHQDEQGNGGEFSIKTLAELRARARDYHDSDAVTGR
jgi:hypothetical protein